MADVATIVQRVLALDYTVQADVRAAGESAVAVLAPLLENPDEGIRLLAVHCLGATASAAATAELDRALVDADPQVAMAAAKNLHALVTNAQAATLGLALERAAEPQVRREIALLLGRVANAAQAAELAQRLEAETQPLARDGLVAALARLGHEGARETFSRALLASSGSDRMQSLELAAYIGQPWLLAPLAELLDDTGDLMRVAVDARPDLIQALRGCDLALALIARIGTPGFSFPVSPVRNYTAPQIDEARQFALRRS